MKSMKKFMGLLVAVMLLVVMATSGLAIVTNDQTTSSYKFPSGAQTPIILEGEANFVTTAGAGGDFYRVINIPSNCAVLGVWYSVASTGDSASSTVNIGDTTASNRFGAAVADTAITAGTMAGTNILIHYTGNDFIKVQTATAHTRGKIKVKALVVPFNR